MFISQEITAKSFLVTVKTNEVLYVLAKPMVYIHVVVLKTILKAGNTEKEYKKLFCKFNKINFLMNSSYVIKSEGPLISSISRSRSKFRFFSFLVCWKELPSKQT